MTQDIKDKVNKNEKKIAVIETTMENLSRQFESFTADVKIVFNDIRDTIKDNAKTHEEFRAYAAQQQTFNTTLNKQEGRINEIEKEKEKHEEELKDRLRELEREMAVMKIVKQIVFGLVGAILMEIIGVIAIILIAK